MQARLEHPTLVHVVLFLPTIEDCVVFVQVNRKCQATVLALKANPHVFHYAFERYALFARLFAGIETIDVDVNATKEKPILALVKRVARVRLALTAASHTIARSIAEKVTELHLECFSKALFTTRFPALEKIALRCNVPTDLLKKAYTHFAGLKLFVCRSLKTANAFKALGPPPFRMVVFDEEHVGYFAQRVANVTFFTSTLTATTPPACVAGREITVKSAKTKQCDINPVLRAALPDALAIETPPTSLTAPVAPANTLHLRRLVVGLPPGKEARGADAAPLFFDPAETYRMPFLALLQLDSVRRFRVASPHGTLQHLALSKCADVDLTGLVFGADAELKLERCARVALAVPRNLYSLTVRGCSACAFAGLTDVFPFLRAVAEPCAATFVFRRGSFFNLEDARLPALEIADHFNDIRLTGCTIASLAITSPDTSAPEAAPPPAEANVSRCPPKVTLSRCAVAERFEQRPFVASFEATDTAFGSFAAQGIGRLRLVGATFAGGVSVGAVKEMACSAGQQRLLEAAHPAQLTVFDAAETLDLSRMRQLKALRVGRTGAIATLAVPPSLQRLVVEGTVKRIVGLEASRVPTKEQERLNRLTG